MVTSVIAVTPAPPGPIGGSAAQRAARAVLKGREYHRDEPSLATRALRWLGDKLDSLFTGGGGTHALLLLLVVVLAVGIVIALRVGAPARTLRAAGAETDPLAPLAARDHRRLAARYTTEGRDAEALREWLRAAVQTIEQRGVLPPRPGRTGAATARQAGAVLPSAAADLEAATAAFDEVWFGGREATGADVARARVAAEATTTARITVPTSAPHGLVVPW